MKPPLAGSCEVRQAATSKAFSEKAEVRYRWMSHGLKGPLLEDLRWNCRSKQIRIWFRTDARLFGNTLSQPHEVKRREMLMCISYLLYTRHNSDALWMFMHLPTFPQSNTLRWLLMCLLQIRRWHLGIRKLTAMKPLNSEDHVKDRTKCHKARVLLPAPQTLMGYNLSQSQTRGKSADFSGWIGSVTCPDEWMIQKFLFKLYITILFSQKPFFYSVRNRRRFCEEIGSSVRYIYFKSKGI